MSATRRSQVPQAKRLEGATRAALRCSPYQPIRNLSCRVEDQAVVLEGALPNSYYKQIAQQTVAGVEGVRAIRNETRLP